MGGTYLHTGSLINFQLLGIDWRTKFGVKLPCIAFLLGVTPGLDEMRLENTEHSTVSSLGVVNMLDR